jgi:hypothetical protein
MRPRFFIPGLQLLPAGREKGKKMKKMIVLALAVASVAMFALPAVASAGTWHLGGSFPAAFTFKGGTATWGTAGGTTIHCGSVSGAGSYANSTSGTMQLTFSGTCQTAGPFGPVHCTSAGQAAGTVRTEVLPIDNVMLHNNVPGVLVTPNANGRVAHFVCGGLITVEWKGNGILGKITKPACEAISTEATVDFNATAHGKQEYTQVTTTGTVYNLKKGEEIIALDTTSAATFPTSRLLDCT